VLYDAGGWGVGELLVEGNSLLWHELPQPGKRRGGAHELADRLAAYFGGERLSFDDVDLDLSWCTLFQADVAETLRRLPYGETVTYGELAALSGHPGAHRAVGTFCARNRFAIVIPCHRVLAADGLGGYGSLGAGYKERLLRLEGAR
jgi:methylated-DNA-[protein]-cysteine S-methyltransferase